MQLYDGKGALRTSLRRRLGERNNLRLNVLLAIDSGALGVVDAVVTP
jgi:hypothetical protein